MQNKKQNAICRLCLISCECNFEDVEAVTIEMLRILDLKLDLNRRGKPVICKSCSEKLQQCFDFKTICIYTEDCINSFRNDGDMVKLDLRDIYLRKNENGNMTQSECPAICRLCMEKAERDRYIALNDETRDAISPKTILSKCFLELDLDVITKPIVCASCNTSLHAYYNFFKKCVGMEDNNNTKKHCEIEKGNRKPQNESNYVLQFAPGNLLNYKYGNADSHEYKNWDDGELQLEEEPQELQIKPEVNECEEVDHIEVEKLCSVSQYNKNEERDETKLKCEYSLETESLGYKINLEETDIKTEDEGTARFQDNMLSPKYTSAAAVYYCDKCKFETEHKLDLKNHLELHKEVSEEGTHQCEKCPYKTQHKYYLNRHMLMHRNDSEGNMFQCHICAFQTKLKHSLKRHILLIHKNISEVETYSSEICAYETKRKDRLNDHVLIHKKSSEVTYWCELCTFKTKEKCVLDQHILTHKNTSAVSMYSCEKCWYKTKQKSHLKLHMLTHKGASEVTTYSCNLCTYKAKRKDNLKRHILVHKNASEATMYSCGICIYSAKQKGNLKEHMLIHENAFMVTTYLCGICTYDLKQKSYLKRDVLIHEDAFEITMYSCGICTYETKQKESLEGHMLNHKKASEVL